MLTRGHLSLKGAASVMFRFFTNIIASIFEWLSAEDIARAQHEAVHRSVMRFSRGNTSVQEGRYMTQSDLDKLRTKGDKAHQRIKARA